jgi:uncharacterized membrane protein YobD (UPF0266 family)
MRATSLVHLAVFDLIIIIIFYEEYIFLQSAVTLSLLGPLILLSTSSQNPRFVFFLDVRNQVSQHKKAGKMQFRLVNLHVLGSRREDKRF